MVGVVGVAIELSWLSGHHDSLAVIHDDNIYNNDNNNDNNDNINNNTTPPTPE